MVVFTYTVTEDGRITTEMVPGWYTGTFLTGPWAGGPLMTDQFSLSGVPSNDNKVLTLAQEGRKFRRLVTPTETSRPQSVIVRTF